MFHARLEFMNSLCDIGCCLCCSCFSCGISVVFFSRQQPQLSWAGCDLALHRGSFKHIRPVELPGDGWSRWNLATFLVRWGGESDRVRYIHQESAGVFKFRRVLQWVRRDEKRQGRSRLIGFHFRCFSPFGIFSWSWIKISWDIWRPLVHRLRTYFRRGLCIANWCPTFSATRSLKHRW